MASEIGDEQAEELLLPEAGAAFAASVEELISTLREFKDTVLSLTDLDDPAQRGSLEDAEARLGLALGRADDAEEDWCGASSFWPTAAVDEGWEADEADEALQAADTETAVLMMRVDLRITDADELVASTNEERDGSDYEASDVAGALQALLPRTVSAVEHSLADFADITWAYAGVSGQDWPVADIVDNLERDVMFAATDDPDLRSFYAMHFE